MTIAAKHMDPIMGVDTHIVMIPSPAGPIPTPLPNPYVGMVMDPFDYLPFLGGNIYINGMMRAQAGTGGIALVPHMPLGGPLVPPPTNESEIFMGSATVASNGDAQSLFGMMVLSCQSVGMPAPPRAKGQPPKSLVLPTSTVLSVPMGPPVLIGGPPTISLMALGFRVGIAALGRLGGIIRRAQRGSGRIGDAMRAITRRANRAGDALADTLRLGARGRQRVRNAICTVTGHPVDVATGRVFTEQTDFELPGPIPFAWTRNWSSTSTYEGALGHGWHHSYQHALYVKHDVVLYRDDEGRALAFPPLEQGEQFFLRRERLTLSRDLGGYALRTSDRLTYHFRDIGRRDDEHVLTLIRNAVGDSIELRYDDRGRLCELIDSGGRPLRFGHDERGRITHIDAPHPDDAEQRVTVAQYSYDAWGDLCEVRDALGQAMRFAYKDHLLVRETNRNGLSFYFEYDGSDEHARCVRTWGDGGIYDHTLSYDETLNVTTVTDSLGYKTQYSHENGLVVQTVDALGGISRAEYDEDKQLVSETDALGRVTRYNYDARGNTTAVERPDGSAIRIAYDAEDQPVEAQDPLEHTWTWYYDQEGRLRERVDPLEHVTRYDYAGRRLGAVTDPAGHTTGVQYDAAGNLSALFPPDGTRSGWSYDGWGRPVRATDANGNEQRRAYDLLSRVVRVEEPDGNVRELSYDPEGNVVRAKDRQHDVRFAYQGMGRMQMREEAGTRVRFEYDTEEQLTGILNEHGHAYRFELGPTGDVLIENGFDGIRRRYRRDVCGQVTEVHRASGLVSSYSYDSAGRVVAVEHSDGTSEHYAYRKDGELIEAENGSTRVSLERDALGRIVKETQGPHWVASEYDALGMRARVHSSLGADLSLQRNAMGDVMHLREAGGFEAQFARDRLGLEVARELPGGLTSTWRRDALGRPAQHEVRAGGQLHRAVSYEWDVNDRLRRVIDALSGPVHYGHDRLGNLAWANYPDGTRELRVPDAVGNLFKTEDRRDRKYGPAGQLLEATTDRSTTTYRYDPEGNLIEKREPSGRLWRYTWAADGMLARVTRPDGSEVSFEYDALGRRIKKHYRGQTTHFVWDGNVPLHEWVEGDLQPLEDDGTVPIWSHDAAIKRREAELSEHLAQGPPERGSKDQPITWLFEAESFAPMARLQGGAAQSILTDHLGTPVLMVDAAGDKTWSASISTWGELRRLQGDRFACPFRWPGQYEDAETGLYYNRFRYYDPEAGEYVSQDPIGLGGGLQPFAYVHDPSTFFDPLGLASCGQRGERAARRWLRGQGFTILGEVKNRSGHGIDIVARSPSGRLTFVEVKTTSGRRAPRMSRAQRAGSQSFADSRLRRARQGDGPWSATDNPNTAAQADDWYQEMNTSGSDGMLIEVREGRAPGDRIRTRQW